MPRDDHDFVDHLMAYRRPNDAVAYVMADLRDDFQALGHLIVELVPETPDRTIAIRSLHRALMDTIAALALNDPT